ncbi:MAG: CocE/NonD family hydrolase [Candidatus Acidiferrales bacterium]
MNFSRWIFSFAFAVIALAAAATPVRAQDNTRVNDMAAQWKAPQTGFDYVKRVEMIPMRDGVKLYTVIVVPNGAKNAPMILTRTPYDAATRARRLRNADSPYMVDELPQGDEVFVKAGYIRVFQDVRGKYGSEGNYLMTPPPVGPLNTTGTDDTTDAYDTIDWLVKNVPESNGRVGMLGSSYEGFTVVMALIHPHAALKVAAPESPMVDGWMGDDWFHYGAFRQNNLDYFTEQTTKRGEGKPIPRMNYDDYTNYLEIGSAGDFARYGGCDQLPFWKLTEAHPAYDAFWQGQALDKIMAKTPLTVPVMWEQGLWDQEDMWGGIHSWAAMEPKDTSNDRNFLVMGPWRHSGANYNGSSLGPLMFDGDTALQWRRDVLLPFFNQYLVEGAPKADTPPVFIYNTGENHWDRFKSWPLSCAGGCANKSKPLYLTENGGLSFDALRDPAANAPPATKYDEYVSDPANPVPYRTRPVAPDDGDAWRRWLVDDQRFVDGRTDVLTYVSAPLTKPLRVSGVPEVNLFASTSGTDSDWAVKLIDVYPGTVESQPGMGGYELAISLDIFRGRYRTSFEHAEAIASNQPLLYRFGLPTVNHVFLPGHRVMVQVQSTMFPLYDRNPQTFVPNIFDAKPGDYQKATQRVWRAPGTASFINLPVVP